MRASYSVPTVVPTTNLGSSPELEVRAALTGTAPRLAIRVELCDREPKGAAEWRRLASLRSRDRGRHVLYHTVPAGVIPAGPVWLRIRQGNSYAEFVRTGVLAQDGRLPWVFLARERQARVATRARRLRSRNVGIRQA